MSHRFPDRNLRRTSELLEIVRNDFEALSNEGSAIGDGSAPRVWYRGLPCSKYALLPTLHRSGIPVESEADLINKFKLNAHEFLEVRPQGEWEWMLLARHHGLPSRLLDWTENPLVGLYFATDTAEQYEKSDGVVWCLSPAELNRIANPAEQSYDVLPMFLDEDELSASDAFLTNYRTSRVRQAVDSVVVAPAAALGIRTTKRIQAQLGVFTIHHADKTPLEEVEHRDHLWKLVIPKEAKAAIRTELQRVGISALTLFPELDNVAVEAKRGYGA